MDNRAIDFLPLIKQATEKYNVPIDILYGVAKTESNFNPKARSPVGALGIAQIMPNTAKQYGINPLDPVQAIDTMGKILSENYKKFGNWPHAVGAYNLGAHGLDLYLAGKRTLPTETANYIPTVFKNAKEFNSSTDNLYDMDTGINGQRRQKNIASIDVNGQPYKAYPTDEYEQQIFSDATSLPDDEANSALTAYLTVQKAANGLSPIHNRVPKSILNGVIKNLKRMGI